MSYPELNVPIRILLGPGPSMVHPRVLRSMATPLIGHLDPAFFQLMGEVQGLLRYTFKTTNLFTMALAGTGSAGMEASLANFVEPGDPVLICVNGYFSERMYEMAKRYGADVKRLEKPWGEIFSPDEVEKAVKEHRPKLVAIVHAETSTGALQPLEGLADVVHQHDALLLVDAVTSLGGTRLLVDEWDLDIVYSATQKALNAPPGLAPITLSERAVEVLKARKTPVTTWYLDLQLIGQYWGIERAYHHTAPISMIYALREALRLVEEEGLERRWRRHERAAQTLWDGLEALGLELYIPPEYRLPTLTTVKVPPDVNERMVRRHLLEDYNVEIAGGLGALKGRVWRIGLMGFSARKENVLMLLAALEDILKRK
ncbi:MAG: alanine--glyoxylate aminotransferase family protein [Chloroflexi bacterium]|nr:alanine--glyoxylate aminotransferase family protein [Chloroflexota bacterium]